MARTARPWFYRQTGWWMVYLNGQKVKLAKGREHRDAAQRKLHELLYLRDTNPAPDSGWHTVASIIELYLKLNHNRYCERALEERRRYLQLFAEAHGWRLVTDRDCLPIHVEQWLADHPEWKSDWTKAQIVTTIMRPFNWAAKKRLIPANPFRGVEQSTGEPRRPLTEAEFQALLRASFVRGQRRRPKMHFPSDWKRRRRPSAAARFRQVLIFLRFTGCRPGELCRLEWSDIDLDNQVIVLRRHKTSKKTKKPRIIPLHPVVLKLLIHLRRRQESDRLVFLTHRRTPWNRSNLSLRVRRAREAAGIPSDAKLYGLRHAFGTRSIVNGVDIKTLAELMGHTTTRMTEHYLHLAGQRAHLAAAMLRANDHRPAL